MDKLARLRTPQGEKTGPGLNDMTQRERDVLALICRGQDDKTIARTLDVSANTVRNHVARIYAKIGVNRRIAAVAWARNHGFDDGTRLEINDREAAHERQDTIRSQDRPCGRCRQAVGPRRQGIGAPLMSTRRRPVFRRARSLPAW